MSRAGIPNRRNNPNFCGERACYGSRRRAERPLACSSLSNAGTSCATISCQRFVSAARLNLHFIHRRFDAIGRRGVDPLNLPEQLLCRIQSMERRRLLPAARLAVPTPLIWHSAHSTCPRHSLAMIVPVISSIARLTSRRLYRSVRGWHAARTTASTMSVAPAIPPPTFSRADPF